MFDSGGANAGEVLSNVTRVAGDIFSAIVAIVVTITAGIIFSLYPRRYRDGIILLFPKDMRPRLRESANATGVALKGWLVGQLISMSIIGVLTTIGLLLIGMPSWLALGLLAGVAQFIPVVGPNVAAIPGVLIGASISMPMMLWSLAVYIGIQQLESNFITPIVMRRAAALPMALTLFSIIAFTALFGIIGALVATPMTVAAKVLIEKLYLEDVLGERAESAAAPRRPRAAAQD
jgi:predicted PurR-regulated permease PerM